MHPDWWSGRGWAGALLTLALILPFAGSPGSVSPGLVGSSGRQSVRTQSQADETPPPAPDSSPFKQKDTPAEAVAEQLNFGGFGVGGDLCTVAADGTMHTLLGASECAIEVLDDVSIRFEAFAPDQAVAVEMTRPDGAVEQSTVEPRESGLPPWSWRSNLGAPLGEYTVVAKQGERTVTTSFTLRLASSSHIRVSPHLGPPGTAFTVALAGFTPGEPIPLHLYRLLRGVGTHWYLTSLQSPEANERGEVSFTLPTRADDPEGSYLLVPDPPVVGPDAFQGELVLSVSGERPVVDRKEGLASLAEVLVTDANQIWAEVVAKDGEPPERLGRLVAGTWYDELHADIEAMRAQGQYRVARLTAPIVVRSVEEIEFGKFAAVVEERWDDRLYAANGTLLLRFPSRLVLRYVIDAIVDDRGTHWAIVEASLVEEQ